jgi:hypothetical protein
MTETTPLPGSYAAVYLLSGADQTFSSEAMQEVNLSTIGFPRYTVYRITSATKRNFHNTAVPVIQVNPHGSGSMGTVTPDEIWWPAGYVRFLTPLNNDDTIQCLSGKYQLATQLLGSATESFSDRTITEDTTTMGDSAIMRYPVIDDWNSKLMAFWVKVQAGLLTSGGAANSHMQLYHRPGGVAGNAIYLTQTNPGGTSAIAVTVTGPEIVVALGVSGGAIVSTANDVINALNGSVGVQNLGIQALRVGAETGAGLVAVLAHTHLTGGLEATDYAALNGTIVMVQYYSNYTTGLMWTGYALFGQVDWTSKPKETIKANITMSGGNYPMYRVVQ